MTFLQNTVLPQKDISYNYVFNFEDPKMTSGLSLFGEDLKQITEKYFQ